MGRSANCQISSIEVLYLILFDEVTPDYSMDSLKRKEKYQFWSLCLKVNVSCENGELSQSCEQS